jgi:hypothetical protein
MSKLLLAVVALCIVAVSADVTDCVDFCNLVNEACTGTGSETNSNPYLSTAGCLAICATFPTGGATGTSATGNNFECRAYHVGVANTSIALAQGHCVNAGPASGAGVCGSTCAGYCNMIQSTASVTALGGTAIFPTNAVCLATCANFLSNGVLGQTNPAIQAGNTAECRAYHISASMTFGAAGDSTSAATHAMHATPRSYQGICVNAADHAAGVSDAVSVFCDRAMSACNTTGTSLLGQYSSRSQCLIDAASYPVSNFTLQYQTSGNSIDCRTYHAGVASDFTSLATNPTVHCPHTGVAAQGVCGTSCEGYCNLAMFSCTGSLAQYADLATCLTVCTGFMTEGSALDVAGDTLGCRVYHAGVAGTSTGLATAHCPHIGVSGGYGVCGTAIQGFCEVQASVCGNTGANSQFASVAACLSAAASFNPNGTVGASTGNTLECRIYHVGAAAASAAAATLHCPHIGSAPSAYCVDGGMTSTGVNAGTSTATVSVAAIVVAAVAAVFSL